MNKLIDKLITRSKFRGQQDLQRWRSALRQAENVDRPRRRMLLEVYDEIMLDTTLGSEIEKGILSVKGSEFELVAEKDGSPDEEKTQLFKKPWFDKVVELAMHSRFYGHSLVQIEELEDGEISDVTLIKRSHIAPETGTFLANEHDETGVQYREDRKYMDWLLEFGEPDDLGLLNKCVPHVLFKRFTNSAWSEYNELFVTPLRVGKTNVKDTESLNRMEDMMRDMAVASYGILDNEEEIEFVESTQTNASDAFDKFIDKCNAELQKAINLAVIGGESKGGSRSKEEVGERLSELVNSANKVRIANYVNHQIIPKLIKLGYPLAGYRFEYKKSKDIKQLWEITNGLLTHKNVDNEWITETFGIPVEDKAVPTTEPNKLEEQLNAIQKKLDSGFFG